MNKDLIEKIQKCLELARRGGTEAEADTAMRKVQELLAKHNLSMKGYIMLSNAHDKTRAIRAQFTNFRPACTNILDFIESQGTERNTLRVQHRGDVSNNLRIVRELMDQAGRSFKMTVEAYKTLAKKTMSHQGLREYVNRLLETPETELEAPRCYEVIERLYDRGPGADLPGVHGTYWGGYNAVTHWIDNYRGKSKKDARLDSALFGQGATLRRRALELALN